MQLCRAECTKQDEAPLTCMYNDVKMNATSGCPKTITAFR